MKWVHVVAVAVLIVAAVMVLTAIVAGVMSMAGG